MNWDEKAREIVTKYAVEWLPAAHTVLMGEAIAAALREAEGAERGRWMRGLIAQGCGYKLTDNGDWQAITYPNPPRGHILDDQGVVRRVLGTLAVTKDGAVVGDGGSVWLPSVNPDQPPSEFVVSISNDAPPNPRGPWVAWGGPDHGAELIADCYSTAQAAGGKA